MKNQHKLAEETAMMNASQAIIEAARNQTLSIDQVPQFVTDFIRCVTAGEANEIETYILTENPI
jgi:hypothetical protein